MRAATVDGVPQGFRHEALLYAGQDEFLRGATSFIRQGLAADEPVLVVVGARKIDRVRGELKGEADRVRFADMAEIGTNPARIIPAWRDFVDTQADHGPFRGIGEPIWAERSRAELVECQRHESLLNLAFAGTPAFRLLCPYDTEALGPSVIDEAHRSHPVVVEGGREQPSTTYRSLELVTEPFDQPLPEPNQAEQLSFHIGELRAVRTFVRRLALDAGMSERRAVDLQLVVNEVATNSLRHGGGRGILRVWVEGDAVICDVRDAGRIDAPLVGRERPTPDQEGGRGLWVANQVCELVQVRSTAGGSVVRLHMRRR